MNLDLKELRQLSGEALGGPMVQWPSRWQPWWKDPRIHAQAFQDALSPDVMLALLDRLEYAEAVVERVKAEIVLVESASRYLAGEPAPIRFFAKKLKALLGDAAQEEQ